MLNQMEYMELGPTPCDEKCASVGEDDFAEQSRIETSAYRKQLERLFPSAQFRVKSFPHDFGTYREACVFYEEDDEEGAELAYKAEANLPQSWDEEAKKELKTAGYRHWN
jgi:hypothetical protein